MFTYHSIGCSRGWRAGDGDYASGGGSSFTGPCGDNSRQYRADRSSSPRCRHQGYSRFLFCGNHSPSMVPCASALVWASASTDLRNLVGKNRYFTRPRVVGTRAARCVASAARRRAVPYVVRPCGMLDPWSLRQRRLKKRLALFVSHKRMLDRHDVWSYAARKLRISLSGFIAYQESPTNHPQWRLPG